MSDYLSEGEYRTLCEECDSLLLANDSTIERVAIVWLHIIREHPMFLKKYVNLFDANYSESSKDNLRGLLPPFLNSFANFRKYLHTRGSYYRSSIDRSYKLDVLFVSHLLNEQHAGQDTDSYFGDIPLQLTQLGFKVGIVMVNHTDLKAQDAADAWKDNQIPRFIFSPILPLKTEVSMLSKLRQESIKLKARSYRTKDDFLKKLTQNAAKQAVTSLTQTTYRLGFQIAKLLDDFKPNTVITTFEGHPYERIVYSTSRRINRETLCIGYQHAAIFKLQHAIRRNLMPEYNPDRIMTAGLIGKAQLENSNTYKSIPITVLGSDRGTAGEKNGIHLVNKPDLSKRCCLVLPEGDLNECRILFEYSLNCAKFFPDIQFIWRLHPILTFEKIFKKYSHLLEIPKNIVLSRETLNHDIDLSCMVLYRGTTAIIQSIKRGLIPMYLNISGEMVIDPLYEISPGKMILNDVTDFKDFVENIEDFIEENRSARMDLIRYCEDYYTNFDVNSLIQILPKKHN